jgi:hypothetical protein
MTTLLVSKVDNIPVIQVGDSKLIVKNRSQNASKVGGFVGKFGGIGFSGENKTVDIGKGRKEVSLRVFVDHRSDNDALFDILYNKRFCTIVDKFKGKIKVYVDSVTVTDSDKHVNRTLFDIKALVQDLSKSTSVNFTQNLSSVIDVIRKDKLGDLWKNLSVVATNIEDSPSYDGGILGFMNPSLDKLLDGIGSIMSVRTDITDIYGQVSRKADLLRSTRDMIIGLVNFPETFLTMVDELMGDLAETVSPLTRLSTNIKPKLNDNVDNENYDEGVTRVAIVPIVHPRVRGENLENIDASTLSQIDKENLEIDLTCTHIINNIKLMVDIQSILSGGFASRDDFELIISETLKRLEYVGYSDSEIAQVTYIIKSFAHQQQYKNLITVNIPIAKSLLRIVYDRYGNTDNYMRIESLNKFKDNDHIVGDIVLFA